jgi:hypothetical protein
MGDGSKLRVNHTRCKCLARDTFTLYIHRHTAYINSQQSRGMMVLVSVRKVSQRVARIRGSCLLIDLGRDVRAQDGYESETGAVYPPCYIHQK